MGLPGAEEPDRPLHPNLRARRAPALCRHQHVLESAVRRGWRNTCGNYDVAVLGAPLRRGNDVPTGHTFWPPGHSQNLHSLQARTVSSSVLTSASRSRSVTSAISSRSRRTSRKPSTRSPKRGESRLRFRGLPGRARRRPLDRLSDEPAACAEHLAEQKISGSSTSTDTSTPRRPTSTSGCTPLRGSTRRTCRTCRPKIWCKSASAAGRRHNRGEELVASGGRRRS